LIPTAALAWQAKHRGVPTVVEACRRATHQAFRPPSKRAAGARAISPSVPVEARRRGSRHWSLPGQGCRLPVAGRLWLSVGLAPLVPARSRSPVAGRRSAVAVGGTVGRPVEGRWRGISARAVRPAS